MSIFDDIGNFFNGDNPPSGNTIDSVWGGNQSTATGNVCNPLDPNYDPNDPSCYSSSSDPNYGGDTNVNPTVYGQPQTQPPFNGTIAVNQGGAQVSGGTLNTILNDVLSGLAILNKRPYVPTTTQPVSPYGSSVSAINPATGIPYQTGLVTGGSAGANIGATLQNFVQNNTGILLIAGAAFLLLQMKPVRRNGKTRRNSRGR